MILLCLLQLFLALLHVARRGIEAQLNVVEHLALLVDEHCHIDKELVDKVDTLHVYRSNFTCSNF